MNKQEIDKCVENMKKISEEIGNDKEKARKFLIGAGIYNEDNSLAAPYNGDLSNWAFMSGFSEE